MNRIINGYRQPTPGLSQKQSDQLKDKMETFRKRNKLSYADKNRNDVENIQDLCREINKFMANNP